jgi:uncharacterized SAM-binding protein YcdF (DUF218 family)
LGLPKDIILVENWSTTTEENAYFSALLLNSTGEKMDKRIIVISDTYHLLRCKLLFEKYFEHVRIYPSFSGFFERIYGSIREVPALAKNLWNGNIMWNEKYVIELVNVAIK